MKKYFINKYKAGSTATIASPNLAGNQTRFLQIATFITNYKIVILIHFIILNVLNFSPTNFILMLMRI
jgi:hypothetical protein